MKASNDSNQRYLSLTGIIVDLAHYESMVVPKLNDLKNEVFGSPSVILHRCELKTGCPPFDKLQHDKSLRSKFDKRLLWLFENLDYVVLTTTIDKLAHLHRYRVWQYNPYHYCLECIIERYVQWLERHSGCGDMLAEARGKKEDKKLNKAYSYFYKHGTSFVGAARIRNTLTSRELKLKPKSANICGLQIADLLAHPSFRNSWSKTTGHNMTALFGRKIANILDLGKYDRSWTGNVFGYGLKWLP